MPYTADQIRSLIAAGEGPRIEFKKRIPDAALLARLVSAFSNSSGGVVLVGVGDRGEIVGTDIEEAQQTFRRSLSVLAGPLRADLEALEVDGMTLAVITVGANPQLVLSRDGAFMRLGATSAPMTPEAITKALSEAGQPPDRQSSALAEAIHTLTVRIGQLQEELRQASRMSRQLPGYLVSGAIGAVLGWLVSKLLG